MTNKKTFISIFVLIISMLACCFVLTNNKTMSVYAAESTQDCYYLIGQDGEPYQANAAVGTIEGVGKFIVGASNIKLTATANSSYQLKGWLITYLEQDNKTEYIDTGSLEDDKISIEMTAKDGETKTNATIEFMLKDNVYQTSTFTLESVFENLTITPVFDHVYYFVDMSELVKISTLENKTNIDDNALFYETATTNDDVITYSNAYVQIGDAYYYYGDIHSKDGRFYTIHETLTEESVAQEIDYTLGAFRVGDAVSLDFDVSTKEDLVSSINIDLIASSIVGDSTISLTKTSDKNLENSFKISQDDYLRTTDYEINFNVVSSKNQQNLIDIVYHDLYVVDLNIVIDGSSTHNETSDVFGEFEVKANEILSNISIYNFYSRTNENNLQFLVKKSQDNSAKAFGIVCSQTIGKTIDGVNYRYYDFKSLDTTSSTSQYYSNINQNIAITIEYTSAQYEINFICVEYVEDSNGNVTLTEISGNTLETMFIKRVDESVNLTAQDLESVENVGYNFVGFTESLNEDVQKTLTYAIDAQKPKGTTIYLCFEKIEYSVVFANYNQVKIGDLTPLNAINFTIENGSNVLSETFNSTDLTNDSVTLKNKIKVNGTLTILDVVNEGFNILGYSTKAPADVTGDDYILDKILTFDANLIKEYNIENQIVIYVYEDYVSYTLTYYIEPTEDNNLNEDVVMANINAEASATIKKYDINDQLISAENNNLNSLIAKIVVSNLKLNDEVILTSSPLTAGEGEDQYTYVFNWFTADGKSTLSYVQENGIYTHIETIAQSRMIKVVYSMPSTKIFIAVEEEFSTNTNFTYSFKLDNEGVEIAPDDGTENIFTLEVGLNITITISNVAFGYNLVGCQHVELNEELDVDEMQIKHITKVGVNTLLLDFERIEYHFIFSQYGGGLNGQVATIDGKGYAVLDVDNTTTTIEKPIGYYVSKVRFNETDSEYSEKVSENNEYRKNGDIETFNFTLAREDFINIVTNYGTAHAETSVTEITVRLDYSIFTYIVQVNYGITNPKGDSRDDYVTYPSIELRYVYAGETTIATIDYSMGVNTIAFINIPYNSQATMTLLSGATSGFSLSGWCNVDGSRVTQDDYTHSLQYLIVGSLVEDKTFIYNLTYNAYQLNVVYVSEQGNPLTYINNNLVSGDSKQITLYDKFSIASNASRSKGYIFDNITYKTPKYTEYVYSDESWNSRYASLYLLKNGEYQLNTSSQYNDAETYYVYTEEIVVWGETTFLDDSFLVSNYALDADGKTITFSVNYKLLELTIVNTITEKAQYFGWKLTGRGTENARVEFVKEDMAEFTIVAVGRDGAERIVENGVGVNFYDTVTINVQINKNALNVDGKEYDLSLGLTLNMVKIAGKAIGFTGGNGEYSFSFYVGQYLPALGEEIQISYELYIATKTVNVTTIVTNSTSFYENIKLYINAAKYNFETSPLVNENNASNISHSFQFLAKANIYAMFSTENYKNNFVVSGVKIYCNGVEISQNDYLANGIELSEEDGDIFVDVRFFSNVDVVFFVQPKISYNGGPVYTKSFLCDNEGVGIAQTLSIGSSSNNDIQLAEMLKNSISIKYISTEANSVVVDDVTTVGRYNVLISFQDTDELDWLDEINVAENVVLVIQPKEIYLTYDVENLQTVKKTYDGTSNYNVTNVYKYLTFTDNKNLNIKYSDIMNSQSNNLVLNSANCYIATSGKDTAVSSANENIFYNLYIYNFTLKNNEFNNNFVIQNSDFVIYSYIQITRRELKLQNVYVYNKVYDGTNTAELVSSENISIANKIFGDDVSINVARLNPRFDSSEVGTNKKVIIDVTTALSGKDINNYYIDAIESQGLTIYPYSLSTTINGIGTIEVINKRGLTEKDKVDLIPLNATLSVQPIYADSQRYVSIYGKIGKYLKGNAEFAIGYEISFIVNGENVSIDNNLYLSIPQVKNIISAYFLTGQKTGEINYTIENGNMLFDLSQISEDVNSVFFTKTKVLFKAWQIILIVVGVILLIALLVLLFIIIRKRKVDRNSVHEKI